MNALRTSLLFLSLTGHAFSQQVFEITPSGPAWGSWGTRTEWKDNAGQQGGRSGFYQTANPSPASNWYPGASNWQHLLDIRHDSSGNNYALQIAGSFFNQDLWVRKVNNNPAQAWSKVVLEQNNQGRFGSELQFMGGWPSVGFNAYHGGNPATWRFIKNDSASVVQQHYYSDGLVILTSGDGVADAPIAQNLTIFKGNGNMGIGTWEPTHKLTVNGQVKSRGFITDTSAWSDYVFADGHRLAPLTEVEAHIKEKRHLPGVPSEAELVANGLDLGRMAAIHMAKIEELTLHLIAQEKQIEAQKELLATQGSALEALQSRLSQLEQSKR